MSIKIGYYDLYHSRYLFDERLIIIDECLEVEVFWKKIYESGYGIVEVTFWKCFGIEKISHLNLLKESSKLEFKLDLLSNWPRLTIAILRKETD